MSAVLSERIVQEHAASGLPSSERRAGALEALRTSGLPTARDDNWKDANLRALEKNSFRSVATESRRKVAPSELPPAIAGYARYVYVDGAFAPELSSSGIHAGVTVKSGVTSALSASSDERFALLNEAF